MSLIHTVSSSTKSLLEKLTPHLGITPVAITLLGGQKISGVIAELGEDYLSLLATDPKGGQQEQETLVPLSAILLIKLEI